MEKIIKPSDNRLPWYKKNYLVDPKLQFKIVGLLAGIATLASVIICWIAYERLMKLSALFNRSLIAPAALPIAFQEIAHSLMYRLVTVVVLMILTFVVTGILLTHRISGPLWKLQVELRKFLNGEKIRPIYFRHNDEYQELPQLINKLIEGYKR